MRVLICDDEPDVRLLLRLNVEALGYAARTVGSAQQAIEACREEMPDVLLLDVSMPATDGPTLLRELRALGLEPPRTMLVSAITPAELMALATELRVRWMSKPFTADHIERALLELAA